MVATKSHVVAGLDADNGVIRWRHVFEKEDIGNVWDLHVSQKTKQSVSVSGNELLFLRVWDSVSDALVVEHLVRVDRAPDLVSVGQTRLVTGGELEIITYNFDNKKISEGQRFISRTPVQVGKVGGAVCKITDAMVVVCANDRSLHSHAYCLAFHEPFCQLRRLIRRDVGHAVVAPLLGLLEEQRVVQGQQHFIQNFLFGEPLLPCELLCSLITH